jgi:DNA-binding GntR family transcriptional regulator
VAKRSQNSAALGSGSLVDQTAARLRAAIFDGSYPPGSSLRELRIAKEFGVSQATVREALQRLQAKGLVTRQANIGTTVTRLTPQEVRERVQLRVMLEVQAAGLATGRMTEAEYKELGHRLQALSSAVAGDDYYEAVQADLEFHRYIWRCSGNSTLAMVLDQLTVPLMAFVSMMRASGLEHLADVTAAHEPLVAALRSGRQDEIEQAFTKGATSFYEEFMESTPTSRRATAFGMMAPVPRRATESAAGPAGS